MKKISLFAVASAMFVLAASCAQEATVTLPEEEAIEVEKNTIEITVIAQDKPAVEDETKTYVDGSSIKWSDSNEKIKVFEVATPYSGEDVTSASISANGVTTDSGATMSFGVTMDDKSGDKDSDGNVDYTNFDYFAVYPSSAYQTGSAVTSIALNTEGSQTPSSTSFDASKDLLIAKKVENGATQASSLNMQFARVVAIGKMTVKNLESSDDITKITFSAKVGGEDVILAGRTAFNLETAKPVTHYGSNTQDRSIILNYDGQGIKANSSVGMDAFFTCYPFDLAAGDSFKVVVETATQSFTRNVTLTGAQVLSFVTGKASRFSVNMDGILGETKAVDLRYAFLDYGDYDATPGTGNSYSLINVNKSHGDSWETYALKNGAMQINTGYYIKLPDFVENIRTVIVTLPASDAGKTLKLETTSDGSEDDLASVTTDSDVVYEFDLSAKNQKTAYLLSSGTIKISKIEVYAGTDTRVALSTPENVSASLNDDDANVTNSIDVSWDAVVGASSYIITLMDENTDITIKEATSSPYTVTGLNYDMEYMIAVYAVPSDPYINKPSSEADAPSNVTTGAEPAGVAYYEKITDVASVTDGDYIIAAYVSSKYYALSNTFAAKISGAEINVVNNKISGTDGEDYVVSIALNGSGKVSISNGTSYLNCQTSGTDFAIGNSPTWHTLAAGSYGTFSITNTRGLIYQAGTINKFGNYATSNLNGSTYFNIELFKKHDTRGEAGMSWSAASATATYSTGNNLSFTAPTLTPGNATGITYSSSDETIATINASGDVTITALSGNDVKEGSTTISAIFTGDGSYKAQTVTYTLSVVDNRTAVATPSFSPDGGNYTSAQSVTITSSSEGAVIHYTTDGSTPSSSSATYSSSITVSTTSTIKAIAVKNGYKNSEIATAVYTIGNDGSLAHPYNATDVLGIASASNVYVTGRVKSITEVSLSFHNATYVITDETSDIIVYRGKYLNDTDFTSEDQIKVDDEVIVYGNIGQYNSVSQLSQGNHLYSINGKTKVLTAGSLTATPNNSNKQITVAWDAATGSSETISYHVTCGTQSYDANAAGSHTFTMAEYGNYTVTVVASASDAISATASTSATLSDPGAGTKDYYRLITDLNDLTEGTYVVGALRSSSATNNFYFAKASVSSGDWVVSDAAITVAESNGVRKFEIANLPSGAVEFTLTGDNTNGFTISHGSDYLYYTAASNRNLAFAASGSSQKWTVSAKSSPLINGGVVLKAVGSQNYTISENSTATGAIRGYANTTEYRAIYLFKKVNE